MPLVALAPPNVVKLACVEGTSSEIGSECILELKQLMKTKRFVCIPIHADQHWTAIRLKMKEIGSLDVEEVCYFDWLEPISLRNCNYAKKILRLCTMKNTGTFVELPPNRRQT